MSMLKFTSLGPMQAGLSLLMVSLCLPLSASEQFQQDGTDMMDFYGDVEFVSIATGTQKPLNKAPAVASVITAAEIELMGATHLDEILQRVPGLHVMPSTISRLDPVYSIRGIQTGFNPQVLVLLNGTEFKNSFSGGLPYTFRFPANIIQRVEIIRGPGTAMYGADAYSGVINIITKDLHNQRQLLAGGRIGSFDKRDAWLHLGSELGSAKVGLAIESQKSDGDGGRVVERDLQSTFDAIFGTSASLAPSPLQSQYDIVDIHATVQYENFSFENWWWQQENGGMGPGGAQALDTRGHQKVHEYRGKLEHRYAFNGPLSLHSRLSYLDATSDSFFVLFPAGATLPIGADGNVNFGNPVGLTNFTEGYIGNPQSDHQDTRLDFTLSYTGFTDHDVRVQVGWFKQSLHPEERKNFGPGILNGTQTQVDGSLTDVTGTPFAYVPEVSRTNRHVSLQDVWRLANDWELTMGLRYDDFSDFGHTLNPRFALVWEARHNLSVKLLYGSAFRAPSFNELFLQNNPSALGNPNLDPETIDTYELAFDYHPSFDTRVAINFYSYEATDLIDKTSVPGTTALQTSNLFQLQGRGIEAEYEWRSGSGWHLNANLAYQHTTNDTTAQRIALVPRMTGFVELGYRHGNHWQSALESYWVGGRKRAANDNRAPIADYLLVHLSLQYQLKNPHLKAKGVIRNLFDREAFEPSTGSIPGDYPLPGRSLWFELEYDFEL